MDEYDSLSHSKWECKYHVVFIPKYRRKKLYKELRQHLGEVFKRLAEQKESTVVGGATSRPTMFTSDAGSLHKRQQQLEEKLELVPQTNKKARRRAVGRLDALRRWRPPQSIRRIPFLAIN